MKRAAQFNVEYGGGPQDSGESEGDKFLASMESQIPLCQETLLQRKATENGGNGNGVSAGKISREQESDVRCQGGSAETEAGAGALARYQKARDLQDDRRVLPLRPKRSRFYHSDVYTPDHSQRACPRADQYRPREGDQPQRPSPNYTQCTEEQKHERAANHLVVQFEQMAFEEEKVERRDNRRDRGDRGGGGRNQRGGNNYSRKRRYDDDDDDGRGPPAQRRRRFEEPAQSKLRRMLLNIASSTQLPQVEAAEIANIVTENTEDKELRGVFHDLLQSLVIEQPFKIPFVAAVVFYANEKKPDVAADAIAFIAQYAQEALTTGDWKEFKLLLRFLASLQSLFDGDGVFTILRQLFDTTVDLQAANENDAVGIELVKIILLTIPYAIVSGGSRFHDQAQGLLEITGIVAANMIPIEGLIASYATDAEEKPFPYHSVIGLLQAQLQNEAANGWEFACIPSFQRDPESTGEISTHSFPTLTIPSPVNPGPRHIFPEAFYSLFADQATETVPKTSDIACSLLRDAIVDTIDQLHYNRESVAKYLIDLDCYWSVGIFAKRGTAIDKLGEEAGDRVLWKSEDVILDGIFSQLFKLPEPEHKLVYYHSVVTQLCSVAPAAIAPSLGRAIRFMYNNIPVMDLELANRLLEWLTHHLSNFEFMWKWAEWVNDVELSPLHPKKSFIIAALDKEIRLSFAARIRKTLPKEYHALIPEELDADKNPDFKYDNPQTPFAAEGQLLFQQFRKKATYDEMQETINKIHEQAVEQGIADPLVHSTDAFVTAICRHGAKSLSHVLSCIERGKERLLQVAETSEAARRQIVASVIEYWKNQPGVALNIIDKLLNYSILSPSTIVQWALGDHLDAGEALAESWIYEMVANVVNKVTKRNRQIAAARLKKDLPQEQIDMVNTTLTKDRNATRELFKYIEDTVRGVAEGAADRLIEKETDGSLSAEDGQLIRGWARRWHTAFLRKAQVEETIIGEDAIEAKLRLLAAGIEPPIETKDQNGEGERAAEKSLGEDAEMVEE